MHARICLYDEDVSDSWPFVLLMVVMTTNDIFVVFHILDDM